MTGPGSTETRILVALAGVLAATPALAHHPLGGDVPGTLVDGLMSGLAHPILGVDHLAALVAVGLIAARGAGLLAAPGGWVLGMLAGVALHMAGVGLPFGEALVAGTVLALGLALVAPGALSRPAVLALVAAGGFMHGHALAESIIGAEATPLVAYLAGLAIVQIALAAGIALVARGLGREPAQPAGLRAAGLALAVVGAGFLVSGLVGSA
ncbi:HupE/UreJ family protein [Salinarimonas chemoclinalis]|uniref:HupE/UreJ family protein n=1 Tax=Salinarimonas chemoclinalis TaxID=3241599 RepID=UPI0035564BBA